MNDDELRRIAREVRKDIVTAVHAAKSGHPGGSLGSADIVTYLYFEEMSVDPADPRKADRDLFVLSKGHCAPALYAVLAEKGYFPKEDLKTLRHIGSHLQGHPNMNDTPGVDMSTGSLGQGISAAVGMALSSKTFGPERRVYALTGLGFLGAKQGALAAMARFAAITWLRGASDGPQVRFLFENPDDPVTLGLDPQDAALVRFAADALEVTDLHAWQPDSAGDRILSAALELDPVYA